MANIDNLRKEVDKVQNRLDWLKDNISILPEPEKKAKVDELKTMAESTKIKIQAEIFLLSTQFSAEKKRQKAEAEVLLNTVNEIINLQLSILTWNNNWATWNESWSWSKWKTKKDDDKSSFWDTWRWKALKRTGIIGGIWAWISWLGSKIKWNEDDESDDESDDEDKSDGESTDEKKSWDKTKEKKKRKKGTSEDPPFWDTWYWKALKRTWIWTAAYYISHWIYTKNRWLRDLLDWEQGKKLEFDVALDYCRWAIANQNDKEGMSYGLDLKYHKDTWEIEAYGERVKIDKSNRKIVWLDVNFKKYENMINAAIVIAYLKKTYSWKCSNNYPFHLTWDWKWNINVNTSEGDETAMDWTGNAWRILGVTGWWILWIVSWIFGWLKTWVSVTTVWWVVWYKAGSAYDHNNIMNDLMPELDNDSWKKNLQAYLNDMGCRTIRNQTKEDITESPIKDEIRKCIDEIQRTNPELSARGWRRQFDAIQDPNNPNKYTIKAYWREIYAEIKEEQRKWFLNGITYKDRNMKILWISWWNPAIKTDMTKWRISELELPLEEWIYMSSLLGFYLDNFHHKWNEYPRFEYTWKSIKVIPSIFGKNNIWMYFSDPNLDTLALTKEKFEKRMPTLYKEENRDRFLEFLNDGIVDENNVSIWRKNK